MRHANTNDLHRADDNVTYETIFQNHAKALWAEAYRLLKDSQEAKDLVQDLIIEIWEKRSLSNVQTNVRSYLFQSLRYKCYRHIKTKDTEETRKNAWSFFQDFVTKSESGLEREELKRSISAAIQTLPLQSSNIFTQVFIEGKKRKEVALDMGLSINTVNVHIHTACKKLQEKLKKVL
ncbi:sigma-70 family RNA polymerase sigma factor [Chitinophaga rhizophila]|uniref:Sigma-70 family RNA polymerase sigma factor n=1 Tax=Chitinophaga rhizophila TaxID=2866212 RepID=A0ABS7G7V2_9BACT|nr:sigma-70 family RNA polymerase sigma factor [Chitinophaga rhizophila]MBW8683742.1 sigma-70 family RNA polymerase sigma factor [Chitinophaga rhizophila]